MRLLPWIVACGLALSTTAHADSTPWSVGVTDAQKKTAQSFLDEGNALFLDKKYGEAIVKYTAAVGAWDHPAIRFNLVRCLIQLERPLEAYDNLKLALKYGAAPMEEAVYSEAIAYEKLLASQIGMLVVTCDQGGAKITVDGEPLAACPATQSQRVKPGRHQVVATLQGYLTRTFEVVVVGGTTEKVGVTLEPLAKAARIEHRYSQWMPWTVFASGFVVIGTGALIDLSAAGMMDDYDRAVAQNCPSGSCTSDQLGESADLRDRAETRSAVAVGVMIGGAAVVATGAVLLYLNRGRTVYPDSVETLTPSVTPIQGGATFALGGRF